MNNEHYRLAIMYLEYGRLREYVFWRAAFEFGKAYAIEHYLP